MLGRLARWLRAAGYDTAYDSSLDDAALLRRARAEGRVLLTSDQALARSRGARTLWVASGDLAHQLTTVVNTLGPPAGSPFSRCMACNGLLEPADRADLAGQLPPHILASHDTFSRCPDCQRIYWRGTHWDRMQDVLDKLVRVE
jgi:uncharacterized protein with PIN domain